MASINIDDFPIEINYDFLLITIDCYQFLLIGNYGWIIFSVTSISIDFRYRFLSINYANISQLHFDTVGIAKLLSNLEVKKAAGRY